MWLKRVLNGWHKVGAALTAGGGNQVGALCFLEWQFRPSTLVSWNVCEIGCGQMLFLCLFGDACEIVVQDFCHLLLVPDYLIVMRPVSVFVFLLEAMKGCMEFQKRLWFAYLSSQGRWKCLRIACLVCWPLCYVLYDIFPVIRLPWSIKLSLKTIPFPYDARTSAVRNFDWGVLRCLKDLIEACSSRTWMNSLSQHQYTSSQNHSFYWMTIIVMMV